MGGCGGIGGLCPPTSISKPNNVQQFKFQTSGILLLYGCSEILRTRNFTTFTVYATIFGQLTHVFSNYKEEPDHFTLDLLKMFSLRAIRKKTTMSKILNNRLLCGILDLLIKSSKTREASI